MLMISDPVLFLFLFYGVQLLCTLYSVQLLAFLALFTPWDRIEYTVCGHRLNTFWHFPLNVCEYG